MAKFNFPYDITVDILVRLPIKYLIRFSCVSKHWHSFIISDPKFALLHFKSLSKHKALVRRLLFATSSQISSLDLEAPSFGESSSVRKLTVPFTKPGNSVTIMGSCNGLVCLAVRDHHDNYYIWNPSTGFFEKLLGLSDFITRTMIILYQCYHGFGYVSATNDYKLVIGIDLVFKVDVAVFSLRANTWKKIEASNIYRTESMDPHGTLVNEALHWLSTRIGYGQTILAFDLANEKFRNIALPNIRHSGWSNDRVTFHHLGVVGECLCVVRNCDVSYADSVDVWVMKEYNAPESWSNYYRLRVFQLRESGLDFKPIWVTESGAVVARKCSSSSMELTRVDRKKEEDINGQDDDNIVLCSGEYTAEKCSRFGDWVEYEETLLWHDDYDGLQRDYDGCERQRKRPKLDLVRTASENKYAF